MSKIVVITGCSAGLGIAIAVQAAQKGHKVYATMRDTKKRAALDAAVATTKVDVVVLALDVANTQSVNTCLESIFAKEGRIDVLINNAGSGFVRSTEQASEEDIA